MGQMRFSQGWSTASGTPDFFNCSYRGNIVSTRPHQGDGYLSMLGGKLSAGDWYFYTENVKAKLKSPLKKGKKYRISLYCGLDIYGVNDSFMDFGLYFYSQPLLTDLTKIGCAYKPQLSVNLKELPIDGYRFFDFCFLADRDYDSVLIGPFCNSYSGLMPNAPGSLYYFMLDDLEVVEQDTFNFTADRTIICDSGFVNFSILNFNSSNQYLWILPGSDLDTMHNYRARPVWYNKPGKYNVELVSFGNCNDTVVKKAYIEVIARGEKIDLIQDENIVICKSENTTIRTLNNRKVIWSNGPVSDSLKVNVSGQYTCKFYTGCDTIYDTVYIEFYPTIDFTVDKANFCDSGVANFRIINPRNAMTCYWLFDGGSPSTSTLENPQNIQYRSEGKFYVKLILDGSCKDTIFKPSFIQVVKKLSDRNLIEPDQIEKCDYETIEVKTKNNIPVKWSNGQLSSSIQVTKAGTYVCSYINFCDTILDSVLVSFRPECPCEPFLPNSFSPNNDQLNDYFSLYGYADDMQINIYNRVGEKVFSSTDRKFQWDGKYKGRQLSPGVFIYTLQYENCMKVSKTIRGSINLLY